MAHIDKTYHTLLKKIINEGYKYEDPNRKGIHRIQIPSYQIVHDFKDGFPAITTKQLYWKGVVGELLWILRGDTNIKYLVDNNINIWNKDAYNYYLSKRWDNTKAMSFEKFILEIKTRRKDNGLGDIGRGYGAQLRDWTKEYNSVEGVRSIGIDQFVDLINTLKTNPMATKKTVTFWNPAEKDQCALTPCHWSFEVLVEPLNLLERYKLSTNDDYYIKMMMRDYSSDKCNKELDNKNIPKYQFTLKWHQHSVDTFLGLPFNIASYALLAQIIGKMTNMIPKDIIGNLSNVHIYEPHLDVVKEQLSRDVDKYGKCELDFGKVAQRSLINDTLNKSINSLMINDFKLENYKSYPRIPAEMLAYNK